MIKGRLSIISGECCVCIRQRCAVGLLYETHKTKHKTKPKRQTQRKGTNTIASLPVWAEGGNSL